MFSKVFWEFQNFTDLAKRRHFDKNRSQPWKYCSKIMGFIKQLCYIAVNSWNRVTSQMYQPLDLNLRIWLKISLMSVKLLQAKLLTVNKESKELLFRLHHFRIKINYFTSPQSIHKAWTAVEKAKKNNFRHLNCRLRHFQLILTPRHSQVANWNLDGSKACLCDVCWIFGVWCCFYD